MDDAIRILSREAVRLLTFILRAFAHTWPLWALSIPLAAAVRMSPLAGKLKRTLSMRPVAAVIAATAFGAFSPLCSCSVVPVIFSLLAAGVPLAPVMSFWLASPSMDPEIFFLSVTAIGWPLAAARLTVAALMSLGGGLITIGLQKRGWFSDGFLRDKGRLSARDSSTGLLKPAAKRPFSLAPAAAPRCACRKTEKPRTLSLFLRELLNSLLFVARFMAIAYALEALITFYLPETWIRAVLGAQNAFAVPLAVLVGIPFYTTNAQALGMVGGLLGKGMSEGAALSFLIGGATTTLPAMSAVFGIAKPRVFAVYLGSAVVSALAAGMIWTLL